MIERFVVINPKAHYHNQFNDWETYSRLVRAKLMRGVAMMVPATRSVHDKGALFRGFLANECNPPIKGLPKKKCFVGLANSMTANEVIKHLETATPAERYPLILCDGVVYTKGVKK